ncbi:hypothetical protein ABIF97_004272 [Bradyrhizobium japonicum]
MAYRNSIPLHGSATHHLDLEQNEVLISGVHHTGSSSGKVSGEIHGDRIRFEAAHEQIPMSLFYGFEGKVAEDGTISGAVQLVGSAKEHLGPVFKGQYGSAEFHASQSSRNSR